MGEVSLQVMPYNEKLTSCTVILTQLLQTVVVIRKIILVFWLLFSRTLPSCLTAVVLIKFHQNIIKILKEVQSIVILNVISLVIDPKCVGIHKVDCLFKNASQTPFCPYSVTSIEFLLVHS